MEIGLNLSNHLSGITKPLYKTFAEYLLTNGKNNFSYPLNEFEHELRAYAFRQPDADKIMYFISGISSAVESQN